jgi:hypothetical protein
MKILRTVPRNIHTFNKSFHSNFNMEKVISHLMALRPTTTHNSCQIGTETGDNVRWNRKFVDLYCDSKCMMLEQNMLNAQGWNNLFSNFFSHVHSSLAIKWVEHEADHSHPHAGTIWVLPLHHVFIEWCLIKNRNSFMSRDSAVVIATVYWLDDPNG